MRPRCPAQSRHHPRRRPPGSRTPPQDHPHGRTRGRPLRGVRLLRAGLPQQRPDHDPAPAHRAAPGDGNGKGERRRRAAARAGGRLRLRRCADLRGGRHVPDRPPCPDQHRRPGSTAACRRQRGSGAGGGADGGQALGCHDPDRRRRSRPRGVPTGPPGHGHDPDGPPRCRVRHGAAVDRRPAARRPRQNSGRLDGAGAGRVLHRLHRVDVRSLPLRARCRPGVHGTVPAWRCRGRPAGRPAGPLLARRRGSAQTTPSSPSQAPSPRRWRYRSTGAAVGSRATAGCCIPSSPPRPPGARPPPSRTTPPRRTSRATGPARSAWPGQPGTSSITCPSSSSG